jgi:hypothetical protein
VHDAGGEGWAKALLSSDVYGISQPAASREKMTANKRLMLAAVTSAALVQTITLPLCVNGAKHTVCLRQV